MDAACTAGETMFRGKTKEELRQLTIKSDLTPEIHLAINPQIQSVVDAARRENRKPSANDFGDLVQDSNFLNSLQSGVNRWIANIRQVTQLDHEIKSGTALDEAQFWVNLEKALSRINEIRESEEVVLTLETLKLGKRFHATISFDADTGKLLSFS